MPVRFRLRVQNQSENENENENEEECRLSSDFTSFSFSFLYLMGNMFEFQNLEVYKKAKAFYLDCKRLVADNKLDNNVKDQLRRASFSIPLNIAEGSGKFSKADRKNYFVTARGSVFECVAVIDILCEEEVINKKEFECYVKKADELSRILYTMIKNLS